ncbi:MAG: hypothetical protein PHN74_00670 [Candidatus Pacebacteria bacterium]|nr:hypothetical protein [Candidatus Paceibacterota bacterium]
MRFSEHIASSLILLPLLPVLGENIVIPMIASVVIDSDHIHQLITEKAFTWQKIKFLIKNTNKIYRENPDNAFKNTVYIFHTVEFNIILALLTFWYPPLLLILIGFCFHILCDIIHHHLSGMPVKRWLFFYYFLKANRKKQ